LSRYHNVLPCNSFTFAFQLRAVGLLNTAGFQNSRSRDFLEYLKALYPTVLEISVFGVKLPEISTVSGGNLASMWTEIEQGGKLADISLIQTMAYSG